MSEKEQPQISTLETRWPTREELAEIIGKISIPDKWKVVEPPQYSGEKEKRPVTAEYLQTLGKRLTDEQPMSCDEWDEIVETLYNKVNYSKQPEAQKLWELFLKKGIQGLSHLIITTTVEEIQRQANADEDYNKKYKDPAIRARMWWANGIARFWHNWLTRMLATDAGTGEESILRLGEQMIKKVSIPYTKRTCELNPNIDLSVTPPVRFSHEEMARKEISDVARCMEIARDHLRPTPLDREQLEAEITKTTEEIVAKIVSS